MKQRFAQNLTQETLGSRHTGPDNAETRFLLAMDEVTPSRAAPLPRPFEFTGRVRSFKYAFHGLARMIRCQHNAWIHAVLSVAVIGAGFLFRVSGGDWCWLILAMATVWTAEAMNTAFEFLADAVSPDYHPLVRDAKDVAAGAVLIVAIAAAIVGGIVFWPHVVGMLGK
jgi:diacylglycerol kinase (ATP)